MNAFGGFMIAWQVGVRIFNKELKKTIKRRTFVEAFVTNDIYNASLRELVTKTRLTEDKGTTIEQVVLLYKEFLSATEPGRRVSY